MSLALPHSIRNISAIQRSSVQLSRGASCGRRAEFSAHPSTPRLAPSQARSREPGAVIEHGWGCSCCRVKRIQLLVRITACAFRGVCPYFLVNSSALHFNVRPYVARCSSRLFRGFTEDSTRSAAPLPPLAPGSSMPSILTSGISRGALWVPPESDVEEGFQLMAVPKRKVRRQPFLLSRTCIAAPSAALCRYRPRSLEMLITVTSLVARFRCCFLRFRQRRRGRATGALGSTCDSTPASPGAAAQAPSGPTLLAAPPRVAHSLSPVLWCATRCPKCNAAKQAHWICYKCTPSVNAPAAPPAPGGDE